MLTRLGELIQTQGRQNGHQAIRGALFSAAVDPGGLSVMNIIRFYPTGAVRLNLPKILALSRSISANGKATAQLMSTAIEQSEAAALQASSTNYSALPVLSEVTQFEVIKQPLTLEDQSRDCIEIAAVQYALNQGNKIRVGCISLSEFTAQAPKQMQRAIQTLDTQTVDGYVLDLRGNPGGLLYAGIEIALMRIDEGDVVHLVDRQGENRPFRLPIRH